MVTYHEDVSRIHHWRSGLILGIKPLNWLVLTGGIEVVDRSNDIIGKYSSTQLNSSNAEGLYWQGMLGTQMEFKKRYQIGLRMTIPRINPLSREYWGQSTNSVLETRLRAYQLSIGILILKNRSVRVS